MKLKRCNYKTWLVNHEDGHKDKIFRSLYPYGIFSEIDFDPLFVNKVQEIVLNDSRYLIVIQKIEFQENGRYRATFSLQSEHNSSFTKWRFRNWKENFQIIYESDFNFITVYSKNEDSSKKYLKEFYRNKFNKIVQDRSLPIFELLFKSLVLQLSLNIFSEGDYEKEFQVLDSPIKRLKIPKSFRKGSKKKQHVYPVFSIDRDVWVFSAINEEDAHKIAFFNCEQCITLYVVYCFPVYNKHFRCKYNNVNVVSLFEFLNRTTKQFIGTYTSQIRLIQNNLNEIPYYDKILLKDILELDENNTEYEINEYEIIESLSIMKVMPSNNKELFLYISAINLINSWINRVHKSNAKNKKMISNMNFFRHYLSDVFSNIIHNDLITDYQLYIHNKYSIIEIMGFQFSFSGIPLNDSLRAYISSSRNKTINWKGKKLQPISSPLYKYAKAISYNIN